MIWNDERFRDFSDDGQLAFLFILTHPHMTSIGAMRATLAGLAEEKGWHAERLAEALRKAFTEGMILYDPKAHCLVLPNFVKHNRPESPNVVKGWKTAFDFIPECPLKTKTYHILKDYIKALSIPFQEAFRSLPEVFGKSMPNQEQEQEQERDLFQGGGGRPGDVRGKKKPETPEPPSPPANGSSFSPSSPSIPEEYRSATGEGEVAFLVDIYLKRFPNAQVPAKSARTQIERAQSCKVTTQEIYETFEVTASKSTSKAEKVWDILDPLVKAKSVTPPTGTGTDSSGSRARSRPPSGGLSVDVLKDIAVAATEGKESAK